MSRTLWASVVLLLSVTSMLGTSAEAIPPATRALTVSGNGVEMYPAFDPAIDRYAVTTTDATAGTVDVDVTPGPGETTTIDGGTATHLTGLTPGQRIKVAFTGGASPHVYTVMYLPAGFPKLTVTTGAQGSFPALQAGLIGLTLTSFEATMPPFAAIVDRNGVPVWTSPASHADIDLKQQPSGEITISRPTALSGHTGVSLAVLDGDLAEASRHDVVAPLTNTDGHDSVRLADGSTILIGYEWNADTSKTDATIQKLDPQGQPTFQWSSADYAGETVADATIQGTNGDYAHINSVVSVEDGDIIASMRHLSAVFRIATVAHDGYSPGDVIWKLGGKDSTFTFPNDPEGGPCAQHTASELPNGHILVFDNGTSAFGAGSSLCVDPTNRSSGTYNRNFTRVAEFALDTVAKTATLVWSYAPADTYSLFAGSARRMSNGDTLIAWAADRDVLTTEVDAGTPAGVLWQLTTPTTDVPNKRYTTYRAELITALRPRITTGLADGATVLAGDTVAGAPSCTSWRDEPLECTVTGLSGGAVDTTTLGAHTWQVTAQDGAGNTTTVTRHYTVRRPVGRPDGLIRKAGRSVWHGDNVYGPASSQTIRQRARRTHTATTAWRVQNDGERTDSLRLVAAGTTKRFRVHYFAGTVDVTAAVVAGTYRTPALQPGQAFALKVTVTPTRRARLGSPHTVTMAAVSVGDPERVDRVAAIVTARR